MRQLGMHGRSGGKGGERTRVRNQMGRLFQTMVSLSYTEYDGRQELVSSAIAEHAKLLWNVKRPEEPVLWQSTVTLGGPFFRELIKYPLPLDMNVLKAMKRSSLGLDLYLWLTYRVFSLCEPVAVSWKQLCRQFAPALSGAENDWRHAGNFRTKALRELAKLKQAWPGLDYQVVRGRLVVKPSQNLIVPRRAEALRVDGRDTPHEAMRRHVYRLVGEHPELAKNDSELAEGLKLAAARAGIPYDGHAITAAMNAGRAIAARERGKRERRANPGEPFSGVRGSLPAGVGRRIAALVQVGHGFRCECLVSH